MNEDSSTLLTAAEAALAKLPRATSAQDAPILVFALATTPEVLQAAKALTLAGTAQCIVLGNEVDLWRMCRNERVNPEQLYGILNPQDGPEATALQKLWMSQNPGTTRAQAQAAVRVPATFSRLLVESGEADLMVG